MLLSRMLDAKSSRLVESAQPSHDALPRPSFGPIRFDERPVRATLALNISEALTDEHASQDYPSSTVSETQLRFHYNVFANCLKH